MAGGRVIQRIGDGLGDLEVGVADGFGQAALGEDGGADADDEGEDQGVFDDALGFLVPFMKFMRII